MQLLGLFQPKLFTSYVKSKLENGTKFFLNQKLYPNDVFFNLGEEAQKTGDFVGKFTTPAELKEYYSVCPKGTKPLIIHYLIEHLKWSNILCFVNSAEVTKRLALLLNKLSHGRVRVGQISAKLSTDRRNKTLAKFSKGTYNV